MQEGRGLVVAFLVLLVEDRVGHNAAASPEADRALRVHQGTDGDIAVHVAVETDIADRPAVDASAMRFELFDDFHGANLRRSGDGPAGKTAAQEIYGAMPFG